MQKIRRYITIFVLALIGLFSCTHNSDITNVRTVSFNSEVLPVFQTNCSECHGGGKSEAGLNLTNYNGIMQGITPGNAYKSELYQSITATLGIMPPGKHDALNQDQRSLIFVWINQGAKNN